MPTTTPALTNGLELQALVERMYPLCRSITGDGVRATFDILGEYLPLTRHEVASGTAVFDWTVPNEWNIRDAWVKNAAGERVIDFRVSNLHVVSYSVPVHRKLSLGDLRPHLHTDSRDPDWVPYRTSYYNETWGFCLSERQLAAMPEGEYEVCIDSELAPGHLSYAQCVLPGASEQEVLIYSHTCHPSLANDNLSGLAVCAALAQWLRNRERRYTYRFVFGPGTIGSITWLANNQESLAKIAHGLVLVLVGDDGAFTWKRSRSGNSEIDAVVETVLDGVDHRVEDFFPYGYDERQFCSPGIDLPAGRLSRSANNCYPEYHSSADNLDLVKPANLEQSLRVACDVLELLDANVTWRNLAPYCEPQLGKRGLYRRTGGADVPDRELGLLWLLNQADGKHSLLDVARRSGIHWRQLNSFARELEAAGLFAATDDTVATGRRREKQE